MADKRLLYFTAQRMTAYLWKGGELQAEQMFASGDEGVAAFGVYVSEHAESLYYLLADLVEEDFAQESIPAVRGKDRRALLDRKIAQRYRDTSLALVLSLGVSAAGGRREERVLFTSFTNTQPFQTLLTVLRSRQARLVGVYSAPLLAPLVAKRIGFKNPDFLMVSVAEAGVRQSYVENGQIRFSRLGRIDRGDPQALADMCAAESARTQQYLVNLRIIGRDAGALEVVMLAPGQFKTLYEAACRDTANLHFHILDVDETSRAAGLKKFPSEAGAEALFLHVLAGSQPGQQFAEDDLRRYYHLWRARIALIAAGSAALIFCLLLSSLKLFDLYSVKQQMESDRQQEAVAAQQYARMQLTFPKTPTPSDKLKVIVKNYQSLISQTTTPEPLLAEISNAMANSPQIELERIEWSTQAAADAGKAAPKPGAPAPAAPGAQPVGPVQSAQISGRVNIAQSSDYRAITLIVDQFVEGLRTQPGITVVSRRLPFDITAEKSLSGDIGAQRAAEVPRFTVVINRRTGT
jgi:hypothetical protein